MIELLLAAAEPSKTANLITALYFFTTLLATFTVDYIFVGLGLSAMLRTLGFKKPWFAFVPFCRSFALGAVADRYENGKPSRRYSKRYLIFKIIFATTLAAMALFGIGALVSYGPFYAGESEGIVYGFCLLCVAVFAYPAMIFAVITIVVDINIWWRIYRIFAPSQSVLFLMLSIFLRPANAIICFLIRDREPQDLRQYDTVQ